MTAKQPAHRNASASPALPIRPYQPADEAAVVALWQACGLVRPWNDPRRDIARKLTVQPELFLVGTGGADQLVATAMVGYDGHRGWVNYLAVAPALQRQGWGRRLMALAEALLLARGCPKINLQVRSDNTVATSFYARLGYDIEPVASLGKRLIAD
jgi:ribosomal protein S18 acetylase RimI-like enzyme